MRPIKPTKNSFLPIICSILDINDDIYQENRMKVSIDQKILTAFQRDGHLTHQQLSERVGLSPTPCARRIKRLETDGIITGYGARINAAKQGFDVSVFVSVRLDQQVDDRLRHFERNVRVFPEVVDCWLMTGTFEYLLRVVVRDLHEFEHFLTAKLTKLPGVASLESSVPIRRVKDEATRIA